MEIHCIQCGKVVNAYPTTGEEIYPDRPQFHDDRFYKCNVCSNYVGCHKYGGPLGSIPNGEMRKMRRRIHEVMDPLWKSGRMSRDSVYNRISEGIGWEYHTAKLNSMDEALKVYRLILTFDGE